MFINSRLETSIKYAVLDTESTTFLKGNPYSARNRLCLVGLRIDNVNLSYPIQYGSEPYGAQIDELRRVLGRVDLVVGFNLKYDLAWLKRYGIALAPHVSIWDCQLCEFLLGNQSEPYPSLDISCKRHSLLGKHDDIAIHYWNEGIDTDAVPWAELVAYNSNDLEITDALYLWQRENFPESKRSLFRIQSQDELVLLDMEANGIKFDFDGLQKAARDTRCVIETVEVELRRFTDAWPHFNFDSGDHLSCLLYGGTVSVDVAEQYETTYKSGPTKGMPVLRNRWETVSKVFPKLVEPLEGSALKKEGYWSVDETTLKQVTTNKSTRELINLLLKRSELEKLVSTYFEGILKIKEKYDWQDGFVHGTFNQCRVVTGRLSSEKPNQQNFPDDLNKYIISRFQTEIMDTVN